MPAGMSNTQVNKLGRRLRDSDTISDDDLEMLQRVRMAHADVLDEVARILRDELGLQPTSRLKTVNTLLDKLRRERTMALTTVQDIAGVRIVLGADRGEQDAVVARLIDRFPGARVTDRRVTPSHGYRAVHVVVESGDCLVEIQVRTVGQDLWAQLVERLADSWGRGIRYGEEPEEPDQPDPGGLSRGEVWRLVSESADAIAAVEEAPLATADQVRLLELYKRLAWALGSQLSEG